tara:strand:- start:38 stop:301 length:264 start_codon:yes stop_codon:yes gene_type:complete
VRFPALVGRPKIVIDIVKGVTHDLGLISGEKDTGLYATSPILEFGIMTEKRNQCSPLAVSQCRTSHGRIATASSTQTSDGVTELFPG